MPFWRPLVHGNRADKPERTKEKKKMISTRAPQQDYLIRQTSKFIFLDAEEHFFLFVMQSLLLFFCEIISQLVLAIRHGQDKCQRREVWTVTADILTCYNKRRASAV